MADLCDIDHFFGSDMGASPTGGVNVVSGTDRTTQRILRRLFTNPGGGAYPWHPEYGGGLPQMIGTNINVGAVLSRIRSQISLEPGVAASPAPVVTVQAIPGGIAVQIKYFASTTNDPVTLAFNFVPPSGS